MEKYTYTNYKDYNKAALEYVKDETIKTMRTLCDKTKGIFEIEVERKKVK